MAHLPELIRHENITTARGRWFVFSSPYYRDVKSSDASAWNLMKEIIRAYTNYTHRQDYLERVGFVRNGEIHYMQGFVNYIMWSREQKYIPRSVVKALQEIVNVASNCGDNVGFDLKKNNFGVNEYGTLIFRDPIYVRN
jgi:hypothetical protein